jgi:hypothetical protein
MDPVLRLAVKRAIAQKDGNLISQYTLLIIIPPECRCWVSTPQLIAGSVIKAWYFLKLKLIVSIAIMIFTRQL